jgi:uracil-DNA glycosylase family 4
MLQAIGVRVWVAPVQGRAAGVFDAQRGTDDPAVAAVEPNRTLAAGPHVLHERRDLPPPPASAEEPADPQARAGRIATMDWATLRESAAACTACELHKGRTKSVFASAPGQADWLVVGDPPSADDDGDGVPVSGDAGRLLDNMLTAVRLSRASTALVPAKACVTTIVKCRPPNDRAVDAGEIATCAPYLQRQMALVQPKLVFAMGRCAAHGLVDSAEPVGKLRGMVHRTQGVPMVVTFHPSHLARHSADKAKAWDDLCRAVEVVEAAA